MKRSVKNTIILWMLTITVFAGVITNGTLSAYAASDIKAKVTSPGVDMWKVVGATQTYVIKNGALAPSAPELKVGDSVKLGYQWSIPASAMSGISEGDYFTIDLPDSEYINTIEANRDLLDPYGVKLGDYIIKNGKIKVVLNATGAAQTSLDGGFEMFGTAIKAGENVKLFSGGDVLVTIKPGSGGSGGGGDDAGKAEIPAGEITFKKTGQAKSSLGYLYWRMNVNFDGLQKMVEGHPVITKNNVILEDNLPEEVTIDRSSIKIFTPMYVPTPELKMSGFAIKQLEIPLASGAIISPNPGESYTDFYNRIKNSTTLPIPRVGIYEENRKNTIVVGFGNLPGNGLKYADFMGGGGCIK